MATDYYNKKSSKMTFLVRHASMNEIREIHHRWATTEQWNPGRDDWKNFPAIDPSGFLVGLLNEEIICCISAVQLTPAYGFIGYYICKKEHRGKGYGLRIFQVAQEKLAHLACVGLDGVPAQVHNYQKSGFVSRFEGARHVVTKSEEYPVSAEERALLTIINEKKILEENLENILALQSSIHGVTTATYFRSLLEESDVKSVCYYNNAEGRRTLEGFGAIRPAADGWRVGPLYARTPRIAGTVLKVLAEHLPMGANIYIEVPMMNADAIEVAQSFGMKNLFVCMRMYAGEPPAFDAPCIFGLLSWEVGP